MKRIFYFTFILCFIFIFSGCAKNNSNNENNYQVNRTSSTVNNTQTNDVSNPVQNTNDNTVGQSNDTKPSENPPATETMAYEFSTTIKTKSSNRSTNIQLTCNKLNGTVVKAGSEFSFCKTIGVSKESEGYKKADVIVGDKTIHALGGGNCQVSSTLYNAVLGVSDLKVTERHPHGKDVNYVPEGKDAAIAHGNKDFKFKNDSQKDLKIYASSDGKSVNIKLVFLG